MHHILYNISYIIYNIPYTIWDTIYPTSYVLYHIQYTILYIVPYTIYYIPYIIYYITLQYIYNVINIIVSNTIIITPLSLPTPPPTKPLGGSWTIPHTSWQHLQIGCLRAMMISPLGIVRIDALSPSCGRGTAWPSNPLYLSRVSLTGGFRLLPRQQNLRKPHTLHSWGEARRSFWSTR